MKIVVLQDDFPPHHAGGSGVVAHQLAKEFHKAGHSVSVITAVQQKSLAGQELVDGINVVRIFSNYHPRYRGYLSLYNPLVVRAVENNLKILKPDVIHVHNVHHYLSYYTLIVARRFTKKVYMTAHDAMSIYFDKPFFVQRKNLKTFHPNFFKESFIYQFSVHGLRYNPLRTFIAKLIINNTVNTVVAVSDALKKVLEYNGIRNVSVIHNGIDTALWAEPLGVATFKTERQIGELAVLFGGRSSEAKGSFKIMEAFKLVLKRLPQAQLLVMVDRGFRTEDMIRYARNLQIENSLIFTGWLSGDDLRRAYYAAAVVVVPSLYLDPFPTINLEAFACSKPIVATCFGGSPELVQDQVSGYIINPKDVSLMAERLVTLLEDPALRTKYGQAGYNRVQNSFTLKGQFTNYEKLFLKLT